MQKTLIFVITVIVVIGTYALDSFALDDFKARSTLKNVENFGIIITETYYPKRGGERTSSKYQTEIELKLRMAGIKILSKGEWESGGNTPFLNIKHKTMQVEIGYDVIYFISLEFIQPACLERNSEICVPVITWSSGRWGYVIEDQLNERTRGVLFGLIDTFVNSYLAENPKD